MRDVGTPQVLLRIFSGPQAGAEAGLPPGSFVIGTDESCDIIFAQSGLEPRHLELIVKPPLLQLDTNRKDEASGSASSFIPPTVVPLDGDVHANNETLASGSSLMPGVPLFIGTICVALARPDTVEADWNAVREALQALTLPQPERSGSPQTSPQSGQSARQETSLPAITDDKNVGVQEVDNANKVVTLVPDLAMKTLPTRNYQKSSLFTVFFVVAAMGLLIFRYVPDTDAQKSVEALRQALVENGFEKIDIFLEKHTVVVKGILRDDDERARLLTLARNMQYPVHLDIGIRQDRKNAIEAAFSGRGFQLEVTDDPAENVLRIAGYMQDRLVEEWAFSSSRDDVPDFESSSAGVVQRRIRYAEDVASVLQPALNRANLEFVAVRYLPGYVELRADLDGEQKALLQDVLSTVRGQLGIPVPVKLLTQKQDTAAQGKSKSVKSDVPVAEPPLSTPSFRVAEVVLSPIPFVRLATGERIFEGGLMPGNFLLVHITLHELTLSRGNAESIFTLRGTQ